MLTKKFSWLVILLTTLFSSTLIAQANCPQSFFFVAHAQSGEVVKMPDGNFQLKFHPLNKQIIYFSDRPKRITGTLSITKFLEIGKKGPDSFQVDHPNASIGVISSEAHGSNFAAYNAVILSHAKYDATNNLLSFSIKPLRGTLTEDKIKYLTVFIDSVYAPFMDFNS